MSNYTWLNTSATFNGSNFSTPNNQSQDDRFTDSEITVMHLCHHFFGGVGVVENLVVIAILLHHRQMLTFPANWFVLSLAASDAMACLVTLLLVHIYIIAGRTIPILTVLFGFVVLSTSGNLFAITFNRFLSVYNSLRYPVYMTTRRAKVLALIPWVNAFVLQAYSFVKGKNFASEVYYGALIISIVALNVYLLKTARDKRNEIKRLEAAVFGANAKSSIRDYGLIIRLTIVTLTFFACCIPLMVFGIAYKSDESRSQTSIRRTFSWCIVAIEINAIIDPFVYCINHPIFARYFKKIRKRLPCRKRVTRVVSNRKESGAVYFY